MLCLNATKTKFDEVKRRYLSPCCAAWPHLRQRQY